MNKYFCEVTNKYHDLILEQLNNSDEDAITITATILAVQTSYSAFCNDASFSFFDDAIKSVADEYKGLYSDDQCKRIPQLTNDIIRELTIAISDRESINPLKEMLTFLFEKTKCEYTQSNYGAASIALQQYAEESRTYLIDFKNGAIAKLRSEQNKGQLVSKLVYETVKSANEENEAKANYFSYLCNGLMLSASTMFAVIAQQLLGEPFSIGLFIGRFFLMLLGLSLIRGLFKAFLGKDAEKGNLSPVWYLVFIVIPAVFLLFSK